MTGLAATMKKRGYHIEKEWRLITSGTQQNPSKLPNQRNGNGGERPIIFAQEDGEWIPARRGQDRGHGVAVGIVFKGC